MADTAIDSHSPGTEPMVVVEDLVKRYDNADTNAVDHISFSVPRGTFFALLGPNGAGKTTTISILTTTLRPTGGRAIIAGHDVAEEPGQVRQAAGIIFQKPSLDQNLTAEENVRFHAVLYGLYPFRPAFRLMPAEYRRQVGELAEVLGIPDDMFKPIKTFSGGMKRKLEIIRSLIHRPQILFLDEPTTGLDPSSRRSLWRYLQRVREESGTTLFLTTHYLDEAEQADALCIISQGRIVARGSPREVKSQLIERYVAVDASDRDALLGELSAKAIPFSLDGHVRIDATGPEIHQVLKRIETPLTTIETHAPSLEDAYLEIIEFGELEHVTGGGEDGELEHVTGGGEDGDQAARG